MTKGFGDSKRKKKLDSRDIFSKKEKLENYFKPAVITPYLKEDLGIIERCHESCLKQTRKVNHFIVADGNPNNAIDSWDTNHIILSNSHNDYGNTPRGIGAMSAMNLGFNVIFFLDADNWFEKDHVESILRMKTEMPFLDIAASYRNFVLPEGIFVEPDAVDHEKRHIDTSCMCFFETSFFLLPFWLTMTKEVSCLCDRVMFKRFKDNNLKIGFTEQRTLNYTTNYKIHYARAGIVPPKTAKELDTSNLNKFSEEQFYFRNKFNFNLLNFLKTL